MQDTVLYTDDTKLKDLTVGQLKDIIIETLNSRLFNATTERRMYNYRDGYCFKPSPSIPDGTVYCEMEDSGKC